MVRCRLEHRVEVDGSRPQRLDVTQPLGDAEEVAALVAVDSRRRTPGLQVRRLHQAVRGGETVGEHLVEDRVLHPVRRAREGGTCRPWRAQSGLSSGNSTTSRMLGTSASSIANLSMPRPRPPVGGMPYSNAAMKSSSSRWASS